MKKIVPNDAILIPSSAECKFNGIIFDTYQWSQELFDGSEATFEMLRRPDSVSVICEMDGNIIVLEDEQPHRGTRLSFPGGRVDEQDADIELAAKRELHEETGYEFENWNYQELRACPPAHNTASRPRSFLYVLIDTTASY